MYRYSAYRDRDEGEGIAWLSITILAVVFALFYLASVLATHLLLHYLVNPYLNGELDEDDNAVLLWSAIVWALGSLLLLPLGLVAGWSAEPGLMGIVFLLGQVLGLGVLGGGYGLLVGFGVDWWLWWRQVDRFQDGLEPAGILTLSPPSALETDPIASSANGTGDGAEPMVADPIGFEWYREGVVLGEEV